MTTYYSPHPIFREPYIRAAPPDEGEFHYNGRVYSAATIDTTKCYPYQPLNAVMHMLSICSGDVSGMREGVKLHDVIWLEDRVLYTLTMSKHWARGRWHNTPSERFYHFIVYPFSSIDRCMCCGHGCGAMLGFCRRCSRLVTRIMNDERAEAELRQRLRAEVKDVARLLKQLEGYVNVNINERHLAAPKQAARTME